MSVKYSFLLLTLTILLTNCKQTNTSINLTKEEKDSIAKKLDKYSTYFYQPSDIHRIYKDSAIMYTPAKVNYIQRLSYSYKKVGDHIKAMEILNKAVNIDLKNNKPDALQYRAWSLLYFYRDYIKTIKDVELIEKITKEPYNPCWGEPCGLIKGQALYKLGKFDEAIQTFKRVNEEEEKLNLKPEGNHLIFFYIGRCYTEKKDYDKAIENFIKASKASSDLFPETDYQLGLIYKAMGNLKKAKEYLLKAQKIQDYKLQEPYIERFDEVFPYMIENALDSL